MSTDASNNEQDPGRKSSFHAVSLTTAASLIVAHSAASMAHQRVQGLAKGLPDNNLPISFAPHPALSPAGRGCMRKVIVGQALTRLSHNQQRQAADVSPAVSPCDRSGRWAHTHHSPIRAHVSEKKNPGRADACFAGAGVWSVAGFWRICPGGEKAFRVSRATPSKFTGRRLNRMVLSTGS